MSLGGKKPYLDFQKYKYDEKKRRSFFSFVEKPKKSRALKVFEVSAPPDPLGFSTGSNPFRKQEKKKLNYRRFFSIFFILSFFLAWFWLIFYLPYFDIDNIVYSGIKTLNKEEIQKFVFENYLKSGKYWHRNNYFITKPEKIILGIKEKFDLSDVKITKIFPDRMQIEIIEKNQSMIYCTSYGYYLLNHDGGVIKIIWEKEILPETTSTTVSSTEIMTTTTVFIATSTVEEEVFKPSRKEINIEYSDLPLFCIKKSEKLYLNQKNILPVSFLENIISWQENLKKEGIGTVKYFIGQDNQQSSLEAYLEDTRWYLKISPEDIPQQIQKIKAILNNEEKIKPFEYIDVRFGDRVFWK